MERTNITPEEAIDQVFQYGGKILNKDVETISRNAEKVKGIFGKVRNLAGYVKDIGSVLSLLNDYATGAYTQVPWRVIAALTGGVVYVFSPVDLIPDLIPFVGFADDASVFGAILAFVGVDLAAYRQWKDENNANVNGDDSSNRGAEDITDWGETNFEKVIEKTIMKLNHSNVSWGHGKALTAKMRLNAFEKVMLKNESEEAIVGMIDTSSFNDGKNGFVFTRKFLYFRSFGGNAYRFRWREIMAVKLEGESIYINGVLFSYADNTDANAQIFQVVVAIVNRADLTDEVAAQDETKVVPIADAICKRFNTVKLGNSIFTGSNIPSEKLNNAWSAMCVKEPKENVCLLFDSTVFGSGKEGMLLTDQAIYLKNKLEEPVRIAWDGFAGCADLGDETISFDGAEVVFYRFRGLHDVEQREDVVSALNEFQDYGMNATFQALQGKVKRWEDDIASCEKAAEQASHEEHAGERKIEGKQKPKKTSRQKQGKEEKVEKDKTDGMKFVEAVQVEDDIFEIADGQYKVDHEVRIGEKSKLFIHDAEITFGSGGCIVLNGGKVEIANCKFEAESSELPPGVPKGNFMLYGKSELASIYKCEFDGKGVRAAILIDGETDVSSCVMQNLLSEKNGGSVMGTRFDRAQNYSFRCRKSSFINCMATSQTMLWAMSADIGKCEFVNCSSPWGIVCFAQGCSVDVKNCVFDKCKVSDDGAIVTCFAVDGAPATTGAGIQCCYLSECTYKYSHNACVPNANWVSRDEYSNDLMTFFKR